MSARASPSPRALAALPPRAGASPGLLRRRYSMPETIMRKYRLAQQRSDSDESAPAATPSPVSASPARGSCGSLCESPQRFARRDRELMRKSALLRRLWGRPGAPCVACCCCTGDTCDLCPPPTRAGAARETRSLDGSRSELRPLSGSLASSRNSHAAGWATPKRQRLDSPLRGSEEMLRAAMRNSSDRASEIRYERVAKTEFTDSTFRSHGPEAFSYIETVTDPMTDSDSLKFDKRTVNSGHAAYIEGPTSDAATAEIKSDSRDALDIEHLGPHIDEHSFTDTSDSFSTSMSTAKEINGSVGSKLMKQISKSAHIDGRISERLVSVENDENNVLPYDTPLTIDTPSYELLEIVVSESSNGNHVPAIKTCLPDHATPQTLRPPFFNYKHAQNINIDEYVSNILVESLNSLTDQLESMNASIGNDRKINIVEKEIKVKLQNTGVNTIVHLSPTSNNQIIFGNEELCNKDETKDSCNNPQENRDSITIRDEMISLESNNNLTSGGSAGELSAVRRDRHTPPRRAPCTDWGGGQSPAGADSWDKGDSSPPPDRAPCTAATCDNMMQHDAVNKAVLQQIQKLFQDEFNNIDSNYAVNSIPGISHIEISNVDVFIDKHADTILGNGDTIEVHTENNKDYSDIISSVGAGNYFEDTDSSAVVPRLSAFPHTDSMEVNTSSSEDADLMGSDCTSLVDSLDDPNSPRSILLRKSFSNNSKRSELVRSAIDVLDLLPESALRNEYEQPKEKGESFFIRIKDDDCDCAKENVIVADHMPEKIKERLLRRHRKRELRMECARRSKVKQLKRDLERQRHSEQCRSRRDLERECLAAVNALIDEVIAKIAQDEYKCMRIKQKPSRMVTSKSDENVAKRSWRKDLDYYGSRESLKITKNGSFRSAAERVDRERNKSEKHHIHGKLSLLTHSNATPEDRGPKRIYQKSEIHEGNKCIEILEILEYVNGSQSSAETTNSDENHNQHTYKSKKSRIPIPVYERIQKIPKSSSKIHQRSDEMLVTYPTTHDKVRKGNNIIADMLMEVLADDDNTERNSPVAVEGVGAGRRASVPHCEARSRSNSLRFKRVFDSIPEEKSSLSVDSSNEDVNHNRRASAPTLVDNIHFRNGNGTNLTSKGTESLKTNKGKDSMRSTRETRTTGTSPVLQPEPERSALAQRLKSQTTMTSPSHKSAATSPIRTSAGGTPGSPGDGNAAGAGAGGGAASNKRGLASRSRAWLGFTRPDIKLEEGIALACSSPLLSHRTASVSVE